MDGKVFVTGAQGFLGEAVMRRLPDATSSVLYDLQDADDVGEMFRVYRPSTLVHLGSPSPGGIGKMAEDPMHVAEVLQVDLNVVRGALDAKVERIVTVGSLCSYDPLDSVNGPYGVAKKMLEALLVAAHRRTGMSYAFLELTNLYGPGDQSDHLIPMAIRKIKARKPREPVVFWGTGDEERAFLHVDDASRVLRYQVEGNRCERSRPGPWVVKRVRQVVDEIADLLGCAPEFIRFDASQPSTARKLPPYDDLCVPRDWNQSLREIVDAWRDRA